MSQFESIAALWKKRRFDIVAFELGGCLGLWYLLLPDPFTMMIEPTNSCTLRCPTCPTGSGKMNRPGRMMTYPEFQGIIDQVRDYVHKIILWNYGEPFMNRDILKMIRYATDSGLFVMTSSNGEYFSSPEYCLELVRTGLQHLIVCLDGADQQTLSKFRRGSRFEEITSGIHNITNARSSLKSVTPVIELQFILMSHNQHQRDYMKHHLSRELGVDIYSEKIVGIDFNDPDSQELAREFVPADSSFPQYELDRDGNYRLAGGTPDYCSWIYRRAVVNSDGTVVPCCYDLYSDHVMGNIFSESLRDIWRNVEYREFRRMNNTDRDSIPICGVCPEGRAPIKRGHTV